MNSKRNVYILVVAGLLALVAPHAARALPFNDDMVDNSPSTGKIMRPLPKDSVAIGSLGYHFEKKEDTLNIENPLKGDAASAVRGERLFVVNCSPCHGDIAMPAWAPGPVGKKFLLPPVNLTLDAYKQKQDGYIYGTIHFGGLVIMPALGHKLSPTEHWDIVNYIRKVQASK